MIVGFHFFLPPKVETIQPPTQSNPDLHASKNSEIWIIWISSLSSAEGFQDKKNEIALNSNNPEFFGPFSAEQFRPKIMVDPPYRAILPIASHNSLEFIEIHTFFRPFWHSCPTGLFCSSRSSCVLQGLFGYNNDSSAKTRGPFLSKLNSPQGAAFLI
jgi:hypothetical protein